ncbi:MAG: alkaline phosphatase family protein [Clostridiales bacterium]|nr:alkaline phosphatase family protein [Clostridiales bacterium]
MAILNFFRSIIAWIITFGMFIYGSFAGVNYFDLIGKYKKNVEKVGYENTMKTAVPQTEIYKIIDTFLKDKLPEGKTEKKVIMIGFDGCRADALTLTKEDSAIRRVSGNGGQLVLAYCGGVNYPAVNTQATSTAPGWCTMLTGVWADVHGIKDNGVPKSNDHLTLLTTAVEDGTIDSSAFYVSWGGHFSGEDTTYINEKKYIEEKDLAVKFVKADDDAGTKANVLNDVKSENCSDFIFSILEFCDHTGHGSGFSIKNPEYQKAFQDAEDAANEIIDAIESRATYSTEDWLILMSSDHGGYNTGHGGPTMMERYIHIAANKKYISIGATSNESGHNMAPATCTKPSKCRNCGYTEGVALGHKFNDKGVCERCGAKGTNYVEPTTKPVDDDTPHVD